MGLPAQHEGWRAQQSSSSRCLLAVAARSMRHKQLPIRADDAHHRFTRSLSVDRDFHDFDSTGPSWVASHVLKRDVEAQALIEH